MVSLYTRLADIWDNLFPADHDRHTFLQNLLRTVSPAARILELGCGSGSTADFLADCGFSVAASDPDEDMLGSGGRRFDRSGRHSDDDFFPEAGRVRFFLGDMLGSLSLASEESAQTVLCLGNTLPHLGSTDELDQFFAACRRCLKRGGLVVLQILNHSLVKQEKERHLPDLQFRDLTFRRRLVTNNDGKTILFQTEVASGDVVEHREMTHLLLDISTVEESGTKAGFEMESRFENWNGKPADESSAWFALVFRKRGMR